MFFGSFAHTLDEKGRLVIPRKMREETGVKVFIMKGFDGALSIYKASEFEKLVHEFNTLPFNKKTARDYLRVQLASVSELEIDKSGRVQIPSLLLDKFQIGKEVVVIGMGDHIEVWNRKAYEEYEKKAITGFENTAESLGEEN
ncbi:MAG TPA: division/cell wall cluster transcriptional repressor MraZ [Bacilli bacterium]|nr:division/cell wall cluster transcriptional repressor MraZ [Bacilli bacterium]